MSIAVPPLGAALRPFLPEALFAFLCMAFMRADPGELRRHLSRPWPVLIAIRWTALIVPVLFCVAGTKTSLDQAYPGLYLGLMLQGVASPMVAVPVFAALKRFDVTFVMLTLVTSSLVVPVTASFYAAVYFTAKSPCRRLRWSKALPYPVLIHDDRSQPSACCQ